MAALDDWAVTLILLVVCGVVILCILLSCKLFRSWKFAAFFGAFDEDEKSQLTRRPCNGYTFTPQVPTGTDECASGAQGAYQAYNQPLQPSGFDNQGAVLPAPVESKDVGPWPAEVSSPPHSAQEPLQPLQLQAPEPTPQLDTSPMSVDSTASVASDFDPPEGLQRAGSCESVASDSSVMQLEPEAPKIGQLEFGLEYDSEVSELIISIIQARELETDPVSHSVDSYVKCWVHPKRGQKQQTKVIKESANPVFKERFLFAVEPEDVLTRIVRFQVCSCDKYARHKLLGETELKLCDIDIRQPIRVSMNLRDMDDRAAEFGDMMFSLSYLPTAERLTIVIVKARNLKWSEGKDCGNCFVKVHLLQNGKRAGKKKTSTKKGEKNPIFNEAMIFSVPSSSLGNVQLRISVVEHTEKDRSIGHVIVGANLSGTQGTHWNQMMSSLRKPVAMWHSLRK